MSYAIKFNVDTNKITFSDSLLKEFDEDLTSNLINFVFGYDGFSIYTQRSNLPNSDYNAWKQDLKNCHSQIIITEITSCLELPTDWACKLVKGEVFVLDKCVKKREYIIYLEKLSNGVFRSLTSKVSNYYSKTLNDTRRYDSDKNLVFVGGKSPIRKGYLRSDNYKDMYLTKGRYSDNRDFVVTRQMFLGNPYRSCLSRNFIIIDRRYVLNNCTNLHELLRNNGKIRQNEKFVYADLVVKNEEIFVTYLPYSKLLYLYYEKGFQLGSQFMTTMLRQEMKLTKYIQAIYPERTSEQVKELYDKINFILNPPKPEIKEVSGYEIVKWYDESNYLKEYGSGPLMSSCMRESKHFEKLEFYARNSCVSLITFTVGDKLTGRALLWKCTDGSKVVDRPYLARESDQELLDNYIKEKGYLFVYDFRQRTTSNSKGFSPSYFSDNYTRSFHVKLDYITNELIKSDDIVKRRIEYNSNTSHNIPYLDNFNFFDNSKMLLMTNRDWEDYVEAHDSYARCYYYDYYYNKKLLVLTIEGTLCHQSNVVVSQFHNGFIYKSNALLIDGDNYLKSACTLKNGRWIAPLSVIETIEEVKIVNDLTEEFIAEIDTFFGLIENHPDTNSYTIEEVLTRSLNQEELEYVDEIRIA